MKYVNGRNLFNNGPSKEIPCILGAGKPTTATEGAVGCLYMDTDTGALYKCTKAENGVYTWTQEAGLYYTPVVTQPSDTTMQIAFRPSVSGAPIPNPVVIQLPTGSSDSGENVAIEPAEDDIPCVYFYTGGQGMPFAKSEGKRQVTMEYASATYNAQWYVTAKVQGSSSAGNPNYKKRNWTIEFYTDSTYEGKKKLRFKGWPAMSKFVLKAGWVIPGHLRNVGAAKIWGQIMRSRPDYDALPEELRNSANQGATDGFHVRVFIDGQYWGIYDWIVPKDQLFGQDKDNPAHSILNSELNNQPTCAFATTNPTISGNWSEELLDDITADTEASMENWIKFVAGSTDDEFVANAESYFDVQSVIDAICFDRIILTVDNMCRNQIVFKYDAKWYMGKWDLDAILGLPPVAGQAWFAYNTAYQEGYVAYKDFGITNMLYKRTESLFMDRFKARYWELRKGPLSENNLVRVFGQLSDRLRSIDGLLAEENASTTGNGEFTGMPNVDKDTIQQVREFVVKRCAYMDDVVTNMTPGIPATGITLSASALTFNSTEPQTLTATVEPADSTDPVVWQSSDASIATVISGVVTPVSDGNATITATAGTVSAACAVAVALPTVSCTGITLSDSNVDFSHLSAHTLVATVTPDGCTDPVVWESSNDGVATVSGGVVTAVDNGSCIITAKCGEFTATCAVTVDVVNVLSGVTWEIGDINGVTGATIQTTEKYLSSEFPVSDCAGDRIRCTADGADGKEQKILYYDADGGFISGSYVSSATLHSDVPDTAVTARAVVHLSAISYNIVQIPITGDTEFGSAADALTGQYYNPDTGAVGTSAVLNARMIPATGGMYYWLVNIQSCAFFDDTNSYIGGAGYSADSQRECIAPVGAAYIGVNYLVKNSTIAAVKTMSGPSFTIGHATPGV